MKLFILHFISKFFTEDYSDLQWYWGFSLRHDIHVCQSTKSARNCNLVLQLSSGSFMVTTSHWSSQGCQYDIRLDIRNIFKESDLVRKVCMSYTKPSSQRTRTNYIRTTRNRSFCRLHRSHLQWKFWCIQLAQTILIWQCVLSEHS